MIVLRKGRGSSEGGIEFEGKSRSDQSAVQLLKFNVAYEFDRSFLRAQSRGCVRACLGCELCATSLCTRAVAVHSSLETSPPGARRRWYHTKAKSTKALECETV